MLILERQVFDSIRIGSDIRITLLGIEGKSTVRLGLDVPAGVPIWRSEHDGQMGPAEDSVVDNSLRILLVEDDQVHARLVNKALSQVGTVQTTVMPDGENALEYLRQSGEDPQVRPHLVLQDLSLPGISGLDVLKAVKADAKLRSIPVVMLSCSDGDADIQACLEAGANAFVTKAHDYEELRHSIFRIANFWRHAQQARG